MKEDYFIKLKVVLVFFVKSNIEISKLITNTNYFIEILH